MVKGLVKIKEVRVLDSDQAGTAPLCEGVGQKRATLKIVSTVIRPS